MAERIRECPTPDSWLARIIPRTTTNDAGCWVFPSLDQNGYGKFRFRDAAGARRHTGAHRAVWLAMVGPIPGDLMIDHLCRNRACCNPGHLDLVTNSQNTLRADHSGKRGRSGTNGLLYSCGVHAQEDGYLHVQRSGYIRWVCRICRRAATERYRERKRGRVV